MTAGCQLARSNAELDSLLRLIRWPEQLGDRLYAGSTAAREFDAKHLDLIVSSLA